MKSKIILGAILSIILAGGSVFAAGKPKITMEEAQSTALKRIPGVVENSMQKKKGFLVEILGDDGIKRDVTLNEHGKIKHIVVKL